MSASKQSDKIESLRGFQASLNASIEEYVTLGSAEKVERSKLDQAQSRICSVSSKLVAKTNNIINAIATLGLQPTTNLAARIAIDLDLFRLIKGPTTIDAIAAKTHADRNLLTRIMRMLSASGIFEEAGVECYQANAMSQAMTVPNLRDWVIMNWDINIPLWARLPSYLADTGYRSPENSDELCKIIYGEPFWDHLEHNPAKLAAFDSSMKMSDVMPKAAVPQYPFGEKLRPESRSISGAVTLVDVGGGRGQALEGLIEDHPDLPGRFVLQDLAPTVSSIENTDMKFETMPHDFFTPQPLEGARWYHLRHVLHDWSDSRCLSILSNLKSAMIPDYSSILVHDFVLPDKGCGRFECMLDMNMLMVGGMERSERQWRELLDKAGLNVVGIWAARKGRQGIIEAELKDSEKPRL